MLRVTFRVLVIPAFCRGFHLMSRSFGFRLLMFCEGGGPPRMSANFSQGFLAIYVGCEFERHMQ